MKQINFIVHLMMLCFCFSLMMLKRGCSLVCWSNRVLSQSCKYNQCKQPDNIRTAIFNVTQSFVAIVIHMSLHFCSKGWRNELIRLWFKLLHFFLSSSFSSSASTKHFRVFFFFFGWNWSSFENLLSKRILWSDWTFSLSNQHRAKFPLCFCVV